MATKVPTKRNRLEAFLAERRPAAVDAALRDEIAARLAPVSEDYLRRMLRDTGLPLHPLVEGVRQDTPRELARTLIALARLYPAHPAETRRLVLEAKQHARYLGRSEVHQWTLQWLENPGIFEPWAKLMLERVYGLP